MKRLERIFREAAAHLAPYGRGDVWPHTDFCCHAICFIICPSDYRNSDTDGFVDEPCGPEVDAFTLAMQPTNDDIVDYNIDVFDGWFSDRFTETDAAYGERVLALLFAAEMVRTGDLK